MFLRVTYSKTKRFLKRTIESFKSYFPGGYQRLPKTPPCNPFSCTGAGPRTTHFTYSTREPENTTNHRTNPTTARKETSSLKVKKVKLVVNHHEVDTMKQEMKMMVHGSHGEDEEESSKCLVTRKLKELELMDRNNIDLVLDIEEVLHYYSRLTCPVYRDIIEKFFVEMYSGTFNLSHVR